MAARQQAALLPLHQVAFVACEEQLMLILLLKIVRAAVAAVLCTATRAAQRHSRGVPWCAPSCPCRCRKKIKNRWMGHHEPAAAP